MSRRDKVVTLAVVGGVLILLGVLTDGWWKLEGGAIGLGLREAKLCVGDFGCAHVAYDSGMFSAAGLPALDGAFFRYAKLTYWVGVLAGLALFGHAWLMRSREERRAGWGAGAACGAVILLAIATAGALPDEAADVTSKGWSFWFTLMGCVLGAGSAIPKLIPTSAVAGARDAVAGVGDKIHRAAVGPLADLEDKDKPDPKSVPKARIQRSARSPQPSAKNNESPKG